MRGTAFPDAEPRRKFRYPTAAFRNPKHRITLELITAIGLSPLRLRSLKLGSKPFREQIRGRGSEPALSSNHRETAGVWLEGKIMLTLYSYPGLFGLADNNAFGLKVFAALRLAGIPFRHEHIIDTRKAPHGQLPYIEDGDTVVGDSTAIVDHLIGSGQMRLDVGLSTPQRLQAFSLNRVLDDLYWPMSYSRWKDDRYWPAFRAAMLEQNDGLREADLEAARSYNFERYRFQGIGRYSPDQAYRRGIDDLQLVASMLDDGPFVFSNEPTTADAAIYGFVANILFYPIDTPLRDFVASHPNMVRHCRHIHQMCNG